MKRVIPLAALTLLAVSIAGCLFDSDDDKDSKTGTIKGKVSLILTGDPVPNVKVALLDANAEIDTSDAGDNSHAFVDSAFTNQNGEFAFSSVRPGKYGVAPLGGSDSTVYSFTHNQSTDPAILTMDGGTYNVGFIAEIKNPPGAYYDFVSYRIYFRRPDLYRVNSVKSERRCWGLFAPYWGKDRDSFVLGGANGTPYGIREVWTAGYTAVAYTEENKFKTTVRFTRLSDNKDMSDSFTVSYGFTSFPAESNWMYDIAKDEVTGWWEEAPTWDQLTKN